VLVAGLIRWAGLVALAALLGSLVLEIFVLPRVPALEPARRRLARWRGAAAATLLVTTGGELVIRAMTMTQGGVGSALTAIPAVLAHTHFGAIWMGRAIALGVLLLAVRWSAPRLGLISVLAVAASTAITGHAGDWGDLSPTAFADWIHVVAGGAWTGGLLALAPLLFREARGWPREALIRVCRRFSRLAAWCLAGVVGSGVWNAWVQLPEVSAMWTSGYGRTLAAKVALVTALVAYGAANRYLVLPRLDGNGESGPVHRLRRYVAREALLALGVFAVTAALTESTPPRHTGHTDHVQDQQDDTEKPPRPVSMEELHRAGGVPTGWRFTPPAGDPARGREVFARLGCFACHRVASEGFPGATGPGPDLTGMGHHHPPGYLLESVLNPNAVVVEGRGYTDSKGRSTMPELARGLTVAELLDLVAYLGTL
jgi:putative copper resistance protein D